MGLIKASCREDVPGNEDIYFHAAYRRQYLEVMAASRPGRCSFVEGTPGVSLVADIRVTENRRASCRSPLPPLESNPDLPVIQPIATAY